MAASTRKQPAKSTGAAVYRVALAVGAFGILWTAVPRIDAWQRARFADRMADHAENSPAGVARMAVRRLADTGLESLGALVRLAGSANADAADAAQNAVLGQLTAWEIEFRATGDAVTCTKRMDALAAAIDAHSRRFDENARLWAEQIALRIVAQCDRLPAADAMKLLAHCDRVLTAPAATTANARAEDVSPAPAPVRVATIPDDSPLPTPRSASGRPYSTIPRPPRAMPTPTPSAGAELRLIDEPLAFDHVDPPVAPTDADAGTRANSSEQPLAAPQEAPVTQHPRPLPAPTVDRSLVDVPSPQVMRVMLRRYRQMSDRQLTTQHVTADGYEARAIEQVLRERKVPSVAHRIEGSAAAPRPAADRVLAERVSKLPPVQARTLLRELVADPTEDAETRLQALTLLATSGDPQLAAIAHKRAMEDADPRVAELATQIYRDSQSK